MDKMFFRFSNGNVRDLFLLDRSLSESRLSEKARELCSPNEIKDRDPVSYGTQYRVSVRSEDHIALSIDRPAQVLYELQKVGESCQLDGGLTITAR